MNFKTMMASILVAASVSVFIANTATAANNSDHTIEYDTPKGEPDMQCGDQFGTYYIFNKNNLKKIQVVEHRSRSLIAVPLAISDVKTNSNGVSFSAVYNIGISVESFKMSLDLRQNVLTVFSEGTQKSYPIKCE